MIRPEGTWVCTNPKCNANYVEYVNGCPRCATGEPGGSHKVVHEEDFIISIINMSDKQLDQKIDSIREALNNQ